MHLPIVIASSTIGIGYVYILEDLRVFNIYHKPTKAGLWNPPNLRQTSRILGRYRVVPFTNVWRCENIDDSRDYRVFRYEHEALEYQLEQAIGS